MQAEVILVILGLAFTFGGGRMYQKGRNLQDFGIRTTGRVISVTEKRDKKGILIYYPTIHFLTNNGQPITKNLNLGTSSNDYPKGTEVQIIYDPDDPNECDINSEVRMIFLPVLFMIIGLSFFAYAIFVLFGVIPPLNG